ncbi:MAG: undecaprenyl-phosphate galactose phosphotransferase WbaP [Bryobacterales bacterium]|nr:undecaprenyl-phosphate galactose phosphotransferase WbaP [Bryobacteraceae bacterium]MDW8355179.1 undecaprenyl-phosphate galactose phosphotransferase WbaP [Bryobacterales bacterium]
MATAVKSAAPRQLTVASRRVAALRPFFTGLPLFVSDAVALGVAAGLGILVWNWVKPGIGLEPAPSLMPVWVAALLVYSWLGLYPAAGLSPVEELRRTVLGASLVYLLASALLFLTKGAASTSRGIFLTSWAFSLFFVPCARAVARDWCSRRRWWGVPVFVLGSEPAARRIARELTNRPELGLRPVACVDGDAATALASQCGIRHAVLAVPATTARWDQVVERAAHAFRRLTIVPELDGLGTLWVSASDLGGMLGLEVRQNLLVPANRVVKRLLDVSLAVAAGLLAAPVIAVAALWIKRVSPGRAFYWQEREGEGGRPIRICKLRTMYPDADERLRGYLASNEAARAEWERYVKLRRDPRVLPRVGFFLRRTSLDELPQLWNVLKGEMSLVGPRPLPSYHLERFDGAFRALRRRVRPGLTGLWQVGPRSDGDLEVLRALDAYYIRNWSLWLDLHILARTARAVLTRSGAY